MGNRLGIFFARLMGLMGLGLCGVRAIADSASGANACEHAGGPVGHPLTVAWIDVIALTPKRYGEELALYEVNNLIFRPSRHDFGEDGGPAVPQELVFNLFGSIDDQWGLHDRIQSYLRLLRINFGVTWDFEPVWRTTEGRLGLPQIVGLHAEPRALKLLAQRLRDVGSEYPDATDCFYRRSVTTRFASAVSALAAMLDELPVEFGPLCAQPWATRAKRFDDRWAVFLDPFCMGPDPDTDADPSDLLQLIDQRLVCPFLEQYHQQSIEEFTRHTLCPALALNASAYRSEVLEWALTDMRRPSGELVPNGLAVVERRLPAPADLAAELLFAERFLAVDRAALLRPGTHCNLVTRAIYATVGLNQSQLEAISSPHGGGAHSMRRLLCCAAPERCVPAASQPVGWTYNVMLLGALALSPPPAIDAPARALLLGLGGGELHSALLAFFSQLDVTSVEVSAQMLDLSLRHFHMRDVICSVDELSEAAALVPHSQQATLTGAVVGAAECRSHVVLADAWELLRQTAARGASFHYIVFDMFDAAPSTWDGTPFTGQSNLLPADAGASLLLVRSLLNEEYGLALFHLHTDAVLLGYLAQIRAVFGDERTAVLELGAYLVVVATRGPWFVNSGAYRESSSQTCGGSGTGQCSDRDHEKVEEDGAHPCAGGLERFEANQRAFGTAAGFALPWRLRHSYALKCKDYGLSQSQAMPSAE